MLPTTVESSRPAASCKPNCPKKRPCAVCRVGPRLGLRAKGLCSLSFPDSPLLDREHKLATLWLSVVGTLVACAGVAVLLWGAYKTARP